MGNKTWVVFATAIAFLSLQACIRPDPIPICCYDKPIALHQPFREVEQLFSGKLIIEKNYWGRPAEGHTYSLNEKSALGELEMDNLLTFNFRKGRLCYFSSTTYFDDLDTLKSQLLISGLQSRFKSIVPELDLFNAGNDQNNNFHFESDSINWALRFPPLEYDSQYYFEFEAYLPACRPIDR